MTHQQLVEEWKEKLKRWLNQDLEKNDEELLRHYAFAFQSFLQQAMSAAAKGAAEAGNVEAVSYGNDRLALIQPTPLQFSAAEFKKEGFNYAISLSERQLTDYFKEV
jgi:hypothetical protein